MVNAAQQRKREWKTIYVTPPVKLRARILQALCQAREESEWDDGQMQLCDSVAIAIEEAIEKRKGALS